MRVDCLPIGLCCALSVLNMEVYAQKGNTDSNSSCTGGLVNLLIIIFGVLDVHQAMDLQNAKKNQHKLLVEIAQQANDSPGPLAGAKKGRLSQVALWSLGHFEFHSVAGEIGQNTYLGCRSGGAMHLLIWQNKTCPP